MSFIRLIEEDFSSLPIGILPSDISAIGEYHFLSPGNTGIWYEPNKDTEWFGKTSVWTVREEDGINCMQSECVQHLEQGVTLPMLMTGERMLWQDYEVSAGVWPLTDENLCGIAFRYQDSRHFYLFALHNGSQAVLFCKAGELLTPLVQIDFLHDADTRYTLSAKVEGNHLVCAIDGEEVINHCNQDYSCGAIGLIANQPTRFYDVVLDMELSAYHCVESRKQEERLQLLQKQEKYPQMRLECVIDLKDFGAGRSIRYGDLDGDGRLEMIFVQNVPCLNSGDECMISCITAMNIDGQVLWQIGEPHTQHAMITADVPVQVYDIDMDGNLEIIYCKDFKLIIAEGRTGKTLRSMQMPKNIPHQEFTISQNITFSRIIGDSIRICNFSGKTYPSDLLIKDRYNNLWAYDSELRLLWQRNVNCGHFPYAFDFNGDGRDELIAGHSMLSAEGELLWQLPNMQCHVDEIIIGRFDVACEELQIFMASGEDGVILVSQSGEILKKNEIGHAQRVSAGKFRADLEGIQLCATTFWRNTGIITFFDSQGCALFSQETGANGNVIAPVNWVGDGQDLLLYSADCMFGGLRDGFGDCVVPFPNDGHPTLCCDNVNLFGDEREELLAWDAQRLYVYTQENSPIKTVYRPYKYSHYNYSNYRGEYSFPTPMGV